MKDIQFEALPDTYQSRSVDKLPVRRGYHIDVAEQLRARPGEWAFVTVASNAGSSSSVAHNIRSGSLKAYEPAGSFEAAARTLGDEFRVYARYVGEVSA